MEIHLCQSYHKNNSGSFLMDHCIACHTLCVEWVTRCCVCWQGAWWAGNWSSRATNTTSSDTCCSTGDDVLCMLTRCLMVWELDQRGHQYHLPWHLLFYRWRGVVCVDKVLDGLGIGPAGPPIPPPVTLAVLPYPVEKLADAVSDKCHVCFTPLPEEM